MKVIVREPVETDVPEILIGLRDIERREAYAQTGMNPRRALEGSLALSAERWTAERDGRAVALFGVAAIQPLAAIGEVWMVSTTGIEHCAFTVARRSLEIVARWKGTYRVLGNEVAEENAQAMKWLAWLGFELEPESYMRGGMPFRRFEWRLDDVPTGRCNVGHLNRVDRGRRRDAVAGAAQSGGGDRPEG